VEAGSKAKQSDCGQGRSQRAERPENCQYLLPRANSLRDNLEYERHGSLLAGAAQLGHRCPSSTLADQELLDPQGAQKVLRADSLPDRPPGRVFYGPAMGYCPNFEEELEIEKNPIRYFKALQKYVDDSRKHLPKDSELQNIVDEILCLINTTLYKLENLS
jgi:hypothetical protein